MIEAAMIWNEPNNKSHWDPALDPDWRMFAETAICAGQAIRAAHPTLPRVLGGLSPIDPSFIRNMAALGVLEHLDVLAVHGFPLDWNLWQIGEWPAKIDEIRGGDSLPVWVSEVGVSSFGAEEVQAWGLRRTAELLVGRVPRIQWYSLYDLPRAWEATTRHREAEGSSYYRHFYMGLLREDGTPKPSLEAFAKPRAGARALSVVPFRGSPAGRWLWPDAAAWRALPAHWPVLGRQLPAQRARLVRPADGCAARLRRDGDFLLHAGTSRHRSASYQPAAGACRIRRFLRYHGTALCMIGATVRLARG